MLPITPALGVTVQSLDVFLSDVIIFFSIFDWFMRSKVLSRHAE